jgi:hypothetical protein
MITRGCSGGAPEADTVGGNLQRFSPVRVGAPKALNLGTIR